MFKNLMPAEAAITSLVIIVICGAAGITLRSLYNTYCMKHEDGCDDKTIKRGFALKLITLILFSVAGLYIGNLITIAMSYYTAIHHGMTVDPDTGQHYITYGEMLALNRSSVKETDIDINDLKNKAVIYVRYDCPDCIKLHSQLADIDDIIFLYSRTEKGKAARELYNIELTEVPQGVYINPDGKATTIRITQGSGDDLSLDLQQIAVMREMTNLNTLS